MLQVLAWAFLDHMVEKRSRDDHEEEHHQPAGDDGLCDRQATARRRFSSLTSPPLDAVNLELHSTNGLVGNQHVADHLGSRARHVGLAMLSDVSGSLEGWHSTLWSQAA